MSEHVIYGLFDPETEDLKYIGYTSNIKIRFQAHYNTSNLNGCELVNGTIGGDGNSL